MPGAVDRLNELSNLHLAGVAIEVAKASFFFTDGTLVTVEPTVAGDDVLLTVGSYEPEPDYRAMLQSLCETLTGTHLPSSGHSRFGQALRQAQSILPTLKGE